MTGHGFSKRFMVPSLVKIQESMQVLVGQKENEYLLTIKTTTPF